MDHQETQQDSQSFTVFAWLFAMAAVFQLARGDMGLIDAWRNTPNGATYGDGVVPQIWFGAAILVLILPTRVWPLTLLACTGVIDLWWRLPYASPSIYFHGYVSLQILFTMFYLLVKEKSVRVSRASFMAAFRQSVLVLLVVLFSFAVFHKLTWSSHWWCAGFFQLLTQYYAPFLPMHVVPNSILWFLTVVGESMLVILLFFRRTRWIAILLGIGFAYLVGSVVYGFGSIVLASFAALIVPKITFESLERLAVVRFFRGVASAQVWRVIFALTICVLFFWDHSTGFTLADRGWMFSPGEKPSTIDVITPMQLFWFAYSTTILVCACIAAFLYHSSITASGSSMRSWFGLVLPAFFIFSEISLYMGLKSRPNVAMFSALRVVSCKPNHILLHNRLLMPCFYDDLLLIESSEGVRTVIPTLCLKAKFNHAQRMGSAEPLIKKYRGSTISRLCNGVEEPFDIEDLPGFRASNWIEIVLPRRLFFTDQMNEEDLRFCIPKLFKD